MAKADYFKRGDKIDTQQLANKFVFLSCKPSAGGSSFGVTKVKSEEQILPAIEAAFAESNDCLVEEFVDVMELAVGVCDLNGTIVPFLPTEVILEETFSITIPNIILGELQKSLRPGFQQRK
jgi:D-alanine-D-alanine ligase